MSNIFLWIRNPGGSINGIEQSIGSLPGVSRVELRTDKPRLFRVDYAGQTISAGEILQVARQQHPDTCLVGL